ncbi:hypothetical protein [Pseudomonas sp. D2002]|nr:hypothetical protein [Pseudomonas sp. D2002]NWA81216.1 hypothetical protein [Pseudomonas sp. D2002]
MWLTHSRQPGNLRQANELLAQGIADGLREGAAKHRHLKHRHLKHR